MSWSRHGYEKASYCISQTGRNPAMQRPTALPRIPASASGVSTQRSGPNRSRSPAVARKTPPERPTSSPRTRTSASRASSTCSASLTASTSVSSATLEDPPQLVEVVAEGGRRIDVSVLEDERRIRGGFRLRLRDRSPHHLERVLLDLVRQRVAEDPRAPEVALVATHALALLLLLDAGEVDVGARIVGGRVRRRAVGDRLDEGRAAAAAGTRHGLPRRVEDREDVAAVDAEARHPVTDRLVHERLGPGLRRDRRRPGPRRSWTRRSVTGCR